MYPSRKTDLGSLHSIIQEFYIESNQYYD
jgi:hypothetical protein